MTKQKSDLSRAFSEDGAIKTHVGGQALIEGVMMRGKYNWAVAVREPDGAIYVEEHDLNSGKDKNGWMYWPLVRGCRALVESLMLGFKALEIAALHAFGDEEGEQKAAAEATFVEAEAELEGAAAVAAARAAGYVNAGTIEFVLAPDGQFYFIEMNTRIQVEHPVTELVTGVDLVRQQLRIASGLALRLRQEDVTLQGHAIECRINAEDPVQGFRPCPGRVDFLHFPGGPGVRVDSCLYSGCELSPYYDSMAAKILAYAPTRMETIRRMRRCLEEFTLEGFPTNAELSYQILYHPEFILGECTTAFLDEHLSELLEFSRKLSESGVDA
mgnify:CR=1 FL=1